MALVHAMVVAGEASGDQHAAEVVAELRRREPNLRFFGMGGPKLRAEGTDLLYDAHEISVMGFTEVLPRLRRLLQILRGLARIAKQRKPAFALLVDIPDFNLRLAASLKRLGIPVVYYVSPMVWAWRRGRVRHIARTVERMLCILPFEEHFYRQAGVAAEYVGNPVMLQVPPPDAPETFRRALGLPPDVPTLALLPGSRPGEIRRILPPMVKAAELLSAKRPGLQVIVPVAPGLDPKKLAAFFSQSAVQPHFVTGEAARVVGASDVAVVTSGTAALEAALMQRPFVVVYRTSLLNYALGRLLVRVPYISLANLLVGRALVPELLQGQVTPQAIAEAVDHLWADGPDKTALLNGLRQVRQILGTGHAAVRAAEAVVTVWSPHARAPGGSTRA